MSDNHQVLIVTDDGQGELPDSLQKAVGELELDCSICHPAEAMNHLKDNDSIVAAIMALGHLSQGDPTYKAVAQLADELRKLSINTIAFVDKESSHAFPSNLMADGIHQVSCNESPEMLKGRLVTLIEMQGQMRELTAQINQLQAVSQPVHSHFDDVNKEMQLATRLQQDFLPRELPQLPGLQFATVYRPASWVSGDIYDVMRLDEDHVGFYIADAVGHGMPAALMTMFIKRAIVTKRISNNSYTLIEPSDVLRQLNEDMVAQQLSECQFATCSYGIFNFKTLQLRLSSAGHPPPLRISRDGEVSELTVRGSLLGVFEGIEYETKIFELSQGDKLIVYSDGVELAFDVDGPDETLRFRQEFEYLAHRDIETICQELVDIIDREAGSLHPRDDLTIVAMQLSDKKE